MPNVTSETHSSSSSSRSSRSSSRSSRSSRSRSSRSSRSSSRSSRSSRSRSMAVFSSCCCYAFWIPFPPAAAQIFAAAAGSRMENTMEKITCRQGNTMPLKDGEAPKLHPENA